MFLIGQGVRGIRPVVNAEMTTGLHKGKQTSVLFVNSVVYNPNVQRLAGQISGPDGYSAKLFSTSRIEVFFSLKGVARQGRALERHGCSWED